MKLKKELGQNFLIDQRVINETVKAAQISGDDVVVEVGAGTGALTRPLAERAGKVIAVEIDKDLIPELQESITGLENVQIINEDILKLPITNYFATGERRASTASRHKLPNYKIVGSIPYQITSPLIHKLLKETPRPKSITIIVQKEVAEKITAKPPKATYLSNFVTNFGQARILRTIKPNAFRPQPKVDSGLLQITIHHKPLTVEPERLSAFLHHGFAQPRKMLNKRFPAETLQKLGVDPKRRPQTLKFEEWMKLFINWETSGA